MKHETRYPNLLPRVLPRAAGARWWRSHDGNSHIGYRLSCIAYLLILTSCVSSGKYKRTVAEYDGRITAADSIASLRDASIDSLTLRSSYLEGGNDALLATQDKLQDRLMRQDDELESLRGSFDNTSSQLNDRITELRRELVVADARRDTLAARQRTVVRNYLKGLRDVADMLADSLETRIPAAQFEVYERGGEVTLSVQEDVLFRPRSVESLQDDARIVLRKVTDALQSDPLLKLTVVGHTDNRPNPRRGTDNREYAALRAASIVEALNKTYYISPNRLTVASMGEAAPARSNATPEGQTFNRRIDFVFRSSLGNFIRSLEDLVEEDEK